MHCQIDSSKSKDGYYKIIPHGSIDSDTYDDFRSKIEPLITKTTRFIVVDLTNVSYISSAGLGVFFSVKKKLLENKGELLFTGVQPQIKKLFEIVKALPHETIFQNNEEADKYLYMMMNQEIEKQNRKAGGKN